MIEKKRMQDKIFIDTNIIVYAYSIDEKKKQAITQEILENNSDLYISKQVINEVVNILYKKMQLTSEEIEKVILELDNEFEIFDFDITTQIKAIRLKNNYNLQFYDALIIATALENGCTVLYSEDMQHNLVIEGKLTIINPFKALYE
ncbi:MAG: PIN domain-containing protein [Campylobacterales bacterium]|nr:PIN domain-containing protein [Campylobacterales bacterium]